MAPQGTNPVANSTPAPTSPSPTSKATQIQNLLRLLTTSASIPLPRALPLAAPLSAASLATPDALAATPPTAIAAALTSLPEAERMKTARQIQAAAKKTLNERGRDADSKVDADTTSPPSRKRRRGDYPSTTSSSTNKPYPTLPTPNTNEAAISSTKLTTNRAPLLLAFAVVSLAYTMPSQPEESRLSLGQAVVSAVAGAKGREVGLFESKTGEGGNGMTVGGRKVRVMGREVGVLRRELAAEQEGSEEPAYWALDPDSPDPLPIHTPASAHAYLLKSFSTATSPSSVSTSSIPPKPKTSTPAQKAQNLALLLGALDALFASWAPHLEKGELGSRAWGWYVRVRPEVGEGRAGWGQKGEVDLGAILALKRVVPKEGNKVTEEVAEGEGGP